MTAPLASEEEFSDIDLDDAYSDTDQTQYFTDNDNVSDVSNISNSLLKETSQILPKSVQGRSKALLEYLKNKGEGKISWTKNGKLMVNGRVVVGSNIIDLASHVVRERRAKARKAGSPGPPTGFTVFSKILRELNVPKELVRNKRRWGKIYNTSTPFQTPTGPSTFKTSRWLRM